MITHIDHPEMKTVELKITGKVTNDDYKVTGDHLRKKISEWGELNLLEDIENFEGFELGAFWKNMKFGYDHIKDIKRCAVVTDKKWIQKISDATDPLIDMEVKAFPREQINEARMWVDEPSALT